MARALSTLAGLMLAAGVALMLAAASAAQAHNVWLLPSSTVLSKSEWITVDAAVSNDLFFFNHVPLGLDNLVVTAPDGSTLAMRQPLLIAFSTASSEAALPKLFEQLDRFGVPRRISGFMLPLGYSFNLDGSMMYMSFATIFIAQAYGIDLTISTQIMILLTLMISSKGIAAVPRASLVVITGTLAMFGLPVEGVAIILAIDQFLDMGRTATNVVGNAVATAVITKWEGMLEVEEPDFVDHPHAPAHTAADGRAGLELDESNFDKEG